MKKQLLIAAVSVFALASTANAASPVMYNWSGLYTGLHIGYGFGNSSGTGDGSGAFDSGLVRVVSPNPNGAEVGITLGYNWLMQSQGLFGIEAELGYIVADDSVTKAPDDYGKVELGAYGTLAARLGFVQGPCLIYGKGGVAFADINEQYADLDGGNIDPTDFTKNNNTKTGWVAAVGVEHAMGPNWSLKLEYSFMDFGSDVTTNIDGDLFVLDNQIQTVKVGANFKL